MTDDIKNAVKKIKIATNRLMHSSLVGDYSSAFKGTGLEFDQLREYQMGDDIRFIDWNSSAKMNKMMVKQFIQERDRTVIIMLDLSASTLFSSAHELRKDLITNIAASLAFIASSNKDKVGLLCFSDGIDQWIPPARGKAHYGRVIKALTTLTAQQKKTDLAQALKFLIGLKKRNAIVFMLSDWIDPYSDYARLLNIARVEYDFVAMRMLDKIEHQFPAVGLLEVEDIESGKRSCLNTNAGKGSLNTILEARILEQKRLFEKNRIDLLDLEVGQSFIMPLIKFFHQRTRRQV